MTMSSENKALVKRFGGKVDRYGLGIIAIDCSEENLDRLLNAAREEGRQEARLAARTEDGGELVAEARRLLSQYTFEGASFHMIHRLADALEARPLQGQPSLPEGWRPIETAPRDGTNVLVWRSGYNCVASAKRAKGLPANFPGNHEYPDDATHWMPLPSPPAPDSVAPSGEDSAGSDSVSRQSRTTGRNAKLGGER
jgi:hypothetical protein